MDSNRTITYDLSDYAGMIRRSWWIVGIVAVVGIVAAGFYTMQQPKVWEASAQVLVLPVSTDTNAANGRTSGAINLDTEAQVVKSLTLSEAAGKLMQSKATPNSLLKRVTVTVPPNSTVLNIHFAGTTADEAVNGAKAFAQAYLTNREDSAKADIQASVTLLQNQIKVVSDSLAQEVARRAAMSTSDPNRGIADSTISNLNQQYSSLSAKLSTLNTTPVAPGEITSYPTKPGKPARPIVWLNLAVGGLVGILLGVFAAVTRERMDSKLRRAIDVDRRSNVPLLAELPPRIRPTLQDVFPIAGPGGRTFGRLRNEVVAIRPEGGKVIVVTGASRGPAATMVAANLATAFARAGEKAVLISANMQPGAPISRMFDVPAAPGLLDVLSGRITISEAAQRAPRHPGLRVIPVGGAGSAGGLFQADAVRMMLENLKPEADFIVIEAPSMAASPDAQSLAFLADGAILVAELRRTTHVEIVDAAAQVRRVGCKLLGAVVMSKIDPRQAAIASGPERVAPAPQPRVAEPLTIAPAEVDRNADTSVIEKITDDQEPAEERPTQFLQRLDLDKSGDASRIDA